MKKTFFCALTLILAAPSWGHALDPDFQLLKSVGVEPNGPVLLKYFKDRTVVPDLDELAKLIHQLGDISYQARENAQKEIVNIGPTSLVALKLAQVDADPEIRVRVERIKIVLTAKLDPAVESAAARLLAAIRPPGTAEVLLNYLPYAADQYASEELCAAVKAVAIRQGKADPVVVEALSDEAPVKRYAAAEALLADKDQLPRIRKLLQDPSPLVRLRVALALVNAKEKQAVPVLVDLLGVLNPDQLWQVEAILTHLAGTDVPLAPLGNNEASRKKCRDVWQAWLTKNAGNIDLAKIAEVKAVLGHTLIVQQSLNRIVGGKRLPPMGEVMELDRDKKERWRFEMPNGYPVDAQVIRHNRVLVAEYQGMRFTERDFTGKILWEQNVGGNPIGIQGLPNGNVFVVMQNRLVEFDRGHKQVFSYSRPAHDLFRARKLPNGEVVFITNTGQLTRIDANQKVLKTFPAGGVAVLFGSMDILPGGGVLVPEFQQNRVVEYDRDGRIVTQIKVQWPNSVTRLPNGHTLVGSQNTRRIIEFDARGQEVWSFNPDGIVFNTRKR